MLKWGLAALLALFVVALVMPRVMASDPVRWHVDPRTVEPSDKPNNYLIADYDAVSLPLPPTEVLAQIDAIAMAEPRVTRLVHDEANGRATYIQRSALFGFPDYISVSVSEKAGHSTVALYSRSRFGHSDLGVNKARIERWLTKLNNNVAVE